MTSVRSARTVVILILRYCLVAGGGPPGIEAQSQLETPTPAFEVASIKPQPCTNEGGVGVFIRGNTLRGEHVDLYRLVEFAYGLRRDGPQVSGGPGWARIHRSALVSCCDLGAGTAPRLGSSSSGGVGRSRPLIRRAPSKLPGRASMKHVNSAPISTTTTHHIHGSRNSAARPHTASTKRDLRWAVGDARDSFRRLGDDRNTNGNSTGSG
jgi:hypothetical protein